MPPPTNAAHQAAIWSATTIPDSSSAPWIPTPGTTRADPMHMLLQTLWVMVIFVGISGCWGRTGYDLDTLCLAEHDFSPKCCPEGFHVDKRTCCPDGMHGVFDVEHPS